jgi:hypothetical protein
VPFSSLLIKCFVGESEAKYVKPRSGNTGILFIRRVSATQGWRFWTARSPNDFFNGLLDHFCDRLAVIDDFIGSARGVEVSRVHGYAHMMVDGGSQVARSHRT